MSRPAADRVDVEELRPDEPPGPAGRRPLGRSLPWVLVVGGLIGFAAAFALTYERIQLLLDPGHQTSCDFGAIVSCGTVMTSAQGAVFGFPNPLLGLAGFAVVTTVGMGLLAGATYRRWLWRGLWVGTLLGIGFVIWLMYQSLYVLNQLCPYCMVVWAVTIPIFWYTTLYGAERGHLPMTAARPVVDVLIRNRGAFLALWYFLPAVLILLAFRSQLATAL